ncbi:cysteine hydrolase family protein [Lacrimispora indolis]|uniref:cysteine hydrolase family protein n=1 Tax=Lacrimispora indolis TaxID=69825 RepID=UPI00045EBCB7|nr:isochorismatase family cysteine hydrolase [Lacrimispora indolis]MBE7721389.1 cysteine hydrolase [Lacrimispora celerecrescens]
MKKLLIVVDMQKDFIDGSLGTLEAVSIVPKVKRKIEEYQAAGDEVVFTLDTHEENYLNSQEGKNLPVVHCIRETSGWELDDFLKEFQGKRFEKNTFGSAELGEYVKEREYESIELVGLCTDICVISNALLVKAFLPETPVQVDSACCAGVTVKSHENALEAMKMCQIQVL